MEEYLEKNCLQVIYKKNLSKENYVTTYLIEYSSICKYIKNWKFNRPYCPLRVSEIEKLIELNEWVPPDIHVASYSNSTSLNLFCFDGNNRRKALKNYILKNPTMSYPIFLHTFFNATDTFITKQFININKSVAVSELYINIEDNEQILKKKIKEYVEVFSKTYSGLMSASKICQKPNFQKDIFEQNLYDLYIGLDKKVPIEEIFKILDKLNHETRIKNIAYSNTLTYQKCSKHNMFLFYHARTISINQVKSILLQDK